MSFSIRNDRLWRDGRGVETMLSPHTGGKFAQPPRILVVHFTSGGSARSSAEWFRSKENPGSSAHLVVEREGSVIQCVPFDTVAWHAGKSTWKGLNGLNQYALGIELANWGDLKQRASGWASYAGVIIPDPVLAVHKNGNPDGSRTPIGWEPYPDAQFQALVDITRVLVATYAIDEIVGHDDIAPTRKCDPGPAFEMQRFRSRVFGGRSSNDDGTRAVQSTSGLNLRKGPGTDHDVIQLLAGGTRVLPQEAVGNWLRVDVLDAAGAATLSGWVNAAYLSN